MRRARLASTITVALILCVILQIPTSRTSHAAGCTFPVPHTPTLKLRRLEGKVHYNNKKSQNSLQRMQQSGGQSTAFGKAWIPVGLTLTEISYQIDLKIEAFQLPNGRVCARLSHVDAEMGYDKISVFIARRFRPGTCEYQSIVDHENNHVAVFQQALDTYYPRVQRRLTRATTTIGPGVFISSSDAAEYLRKRLSASITPLYNEMSRTVKRNNARLDTPERYRSEQARCNGW